MVEKAKDAFNNDYLFLRKELIGGRNPLVAAEGMKDWMRKKTDGVVSGIVEERWERLRRNMAHHADRELEWYHRGRQGGDEKDD